MPAAQDTNGVPGAGRVARLLALLREALELVDELDSSPEIGARLQEVITAVEQADKV